MYLKLLNSALVLGSLALLGAVGYQVWQIHFVGNEQSPESLEGSVLAAKPSQPVAQYQLGKITSASLFGKEPVIKEIKKPVIVQKTRLALHLQGMVGSADPDLARALISVGNSPVRSYGLGDAILETDAKIDSIEQDRVLLDRDSRVESLELTRGKLGKK